MAQPGSEADAAIAKGVELRRQGRDDEALVEFQRAHQLAPTAKAKAQMGLAEQAIGRWVDAEAHLKEALATGDPWITKHRAVLEEAFATTGSRLGTLAVRGEPAGAVVDVDGRVVGKLPLADTRVVAGEVVVTVAAPGHFPVTRKLTVSAGSRTAEIFTLRRLEGVPVAAAPDIAAPREPAPVAIESPAAEPAPGRWKRIAAWGAGGAAVLGLAGGLTFQLLAKSNLDTFNDETKGCGIDDANKVVGGASCVDWHQSWERDRTLAIVGYVVGGAFAITSAVLFVTSATSRGTSPEAKQEARLTCLPSGPAGVWCAYRF